MICELLFPSSILAVKLNRKSLVIVLEMEIYIYDISNMRLLHVIETTPNPEGRCCPLLSINSLTLSSSDLCIVSVSRQFVPCLSLASTVTHIPTRLCKLNIVQWIWDVHVIYATIHNFSKSVGRRPPLFHPFVDGRKRYPGPQGTSVIPLHQFNRHTSRYVVREGHCHSSLEHSWRGEALSIQEGNQRG